MKEELYESIKKQIQKTAEEINFDGCEQENTLRYCELMLKHGAGYAVSYTEGLLLHSDIKPTLVSMNRKPTKAGMQFLCEVYYKHSNLQSDGCVWGQKFRTANNEHNT